MELKPQNCWDDKLDCRHMRSVDLEVNRMPCESSHQMNWNELPQRDSLVDDRAKDKTKCVGPWLGPSGLLELQR